jgi:predicted AlkP superfamily phosphohydrolase/phosphomutase
MSRVLVIGLDCAPPALVFDRFARVMPNVTELRRGGAWGPLRSTMPPITVPAWTCMLSGRDPGELGLYGFRKRARGSYALELADARDVHVPRVWDVLGAAGKRVLVLYVPPTSPPSVVNGSLVSCFLGREGQGCTFPPELAASIARFGPHAPDVGEVRDPDVLLEELYTTAQQHFDVGRALWDEERPDFAIMVEMGTDRLHHALWTHLDPSHPAHDPSHRLVREARDYYAFLDAQIGAWIDDAREATVMIVSDHGARRMTGAVCLNEWLRREGWLVLHEEPPSPVPLTAEMVDWSRTKAWAEGGYYARVFVNAVDREPHGIVRDVEGETIALRDAIHAGFPGSSASRPRDLYRDVRGIAPELLVVFDDLARRALSIVGGGIDRPIDDTRAGDGANHDWDGVFVAKGPGISRGERVGLSIYDVGPTILAAMGVAIPDGWLGRDRART